MAADPVADRSAANRNDLSKNLPVDRSRNRRVFARASETVSDQEEGGPEGEKKSATSKAVDPRNAYWEHLLDHGEPPASVFKFCKAAGWMRGHLLLRNCF